MTPVKEKPRFFKNIGKAIGIQIVDTPKPQDVMAAPTVNPTAPTLGEVKTTQVVDFSTPQSLGDKTVDSVAPAPAPVVESPVSSVPPVPSVSPVEAVVPVPPPPAVVSEPVSAQNSIDTPPVIVPAERKDEVSSVAAPSEPVKTPEEPMPPTVPAPAPIQESQNSTMPSEPKVPIEPVVNNPEPVIVSPSMAAPEVVESNTVVKEHEAEPEVEKEETSSVPVVPVEETRNSVQPPEPETAESPLINRPEPAVPVESSVDGPEIEKEEAQSVPSAFENAFKDESENHLNPEMSASEAADNSDEKPEGNGEFNIKINPIADDLFKKNYSKYLKVNAQGEPELDEPGFDEAIDEAEFVKEVQEKPTLKNLLDQLEKRGVTVETAMDVLKSYLK